MKDRKRKGDKLSADKWKTGGIIAALVAAAAVFAAMLQLEKNMLTEYERGTVYAAVKTIPKGQLITEQNWSQYVKEQELERSCIPESALDSPEQIIGLVPEFDVEPGVLLSQGMFEKVSEVLGELKEPVIAGFKADDLYQVVGGVLRAGDRIHIYRVSEEKETTLIWDNVYICQVFDQSGVSIESGNSTAAAQRINVYLDREDVEEFYSELALGTLRVVKAYK